MPVWLHRRPGGLLPAGDMPTLVDPSHRQLSWQPVSSNAGQGSQLLPCMSQCSQAVTRSSGPVLASADSSMQPDLLEHDGTQMQAPRPSVLTMQKRKIPRWQGLLSAQGHAPGPVDPGSWPFAVLGSVAVPVKARTYELRASGPDGAAGASHCKEALACTKHPDPRIWSDPAHPSRHDIPGILSYQGAQRHET